MTIRTFIDSFLDFGLNEHYIGTVLGHSNRGRDAVQRGKIKKINLNKPISIWKDGIFDSEFIKLFSRTA